MSFFDRFDIRKMNLLGTVKSATKHKSKFSSTEQRYETAEPFCPQSND
jgi:hypothetical protein